MQLAGGHHRPVSGHGAGYADGLSGNISGVGGTSGATQLAGPTHRRSPHAGVLVGVVAARHQLPARHVGLHPTTVQQSTFQGRGPQETHRAELSALGSPARPPTMPDDGDNSSFQSTGRCLKPQSRKPNASAFSVNHRASSPREHAETYRRSGHRCSWWRNQGRLPEMRGLDGYRGNPSTGCMLAEPGQVYRRRRTRRTRPSSGSPSPLLTHLSHSPTPNSSPLS